MRSLRLSASSADCITIIDPTKQIIVIAVHMQNCINGLLSAMIFSPRVKSARTFSAALSNLSIS